LTRKLAGLVAAGLVLACASAVDRSGEVLAADRARLDAMVAVDRPTLESSLHESLQYTHSNGRVDTRDALIESLASGTVDYQVVRPIDPQVEVRGETAVLTARVAMQVEAAGKVHDLTLRYTAVYFLEDGRWQLAVYQSVGVAP